MSPSYLYHGKLSSSSGLTSVRVPSPQADFEANLKQISATLASFSLW